MMKRAVRFLGPLAALPCIFLGCLNTGTSDGNESLHVALAGDGAGTVVSDPSGIDCGTICDQDFPIGESVTLTATPSAGSIFTGWSGACEDGMAPTCTVSMSSPQNVSASFTIEHSYGLAIEPSATATTLGTQVSYAITVTGNHFSGSVALSGSGAPSNWAVTITPATVAVSDGVPATAVMLVTIPSNGDAAPAGATLTVNADGDAGRKSASTQLTVADEFVISIPAGTGATGQHWGALTNATIYLKAGTTVRFKNADSIAHRIHGTAVIAHEASELAPGADYVVTAAAGTDEIYCHDHGTSTGVMHFVAQ